MGKRNNRLETMGQSMKRLERMKDYLALAELRNDPSDKLYIEDLKLSISYFESSIIIMTGTDIELEKEFC